jgi:hypothetical protein
MRFWFSTLPLPEALISELVAANLEPWPIDQGSPNGDTCLLVYDSPDRVITAAANAEATISSAALAESYCELMRCSEASRQPLLAGWRLERVGRLGLQSWLAGTEPSGVVGDTEPIRPLVASVILSLLDTQPQLLKAYSDLELQAELLGSEADLAYRQRLKQAITQDDPLPELLAALQSDEGELSAARHKAERTRQELQQVQEQQLLNRRTHGTKGLMANIQALQQWLQPKVANLEQQLENRDRELQQAGDDAERTGQELRQAQKELQQLLLADRQKQQLLDTRTQNMVDLQANIQALQEELKPKVEHLEQQLHNRDCELQQTRDEAELTLLQLHQVQEELEQLFLTDRQKQQLLDIRSDELQSLQANIQALQQELKPKVEHLEQQLHNRDCELQQMRDEAELTLLQLHQVQEELEQLFLTDRQKQQLLDIRSDELQSLQANIQALQQDLQPKVNVLEQQLHNRDRDLQEARDDAELTLLQLHQVQEELERYFLQSRAGSQLVEAQADQLKRAKRLLSKLAMSDVSQRDAVAAVSVEVLPAYEPTSQQPSLQVQALLNAYAGNLDRASALLTRAMRR